jgi:heavy metal sensor kinase
MKFYRSIRWRLQLWYGALLIAVLCGFGITAYQLESGRQFRRIDEELRQRLPVLVESQHPVRGGEQMREFKLSPRGAGLFDGGGDGSFYYVVWLRRSATPVTFSATAPHDVPEPKAGEPPTRQRGDLREAFSFPGPGDCVLVGRSIASDAAELRQLAWTLSAAGTSVLLLALAVGAWLVIRAMRPIGEISSTAEKIATGDLTQRIAIAETDSELGQLATVLNSTFARLDAAFTQQAQFTSDAAHELRTPVTVMLMHAENGLDAECNNPEHREAFEASRRAAQRMRRLIESLLQLARFDAGQEKLHREPFDIVRVAEESIELLQPLADERRIAISRELPPTNCIGDSERIGQVITNLLTNAIIHNKPGGEARVKISRDGDWVVVTVSDNGPGIPAGDLPNIFGRFYRADKSRASSIGGTGLGLAITKAIVEAHGGTISATGTPGSGTIFEVRLPSGSSRA